MLHRNCFISFTFFLWVITLLGLCTAENETPTFESVLQESTKHLSNKVVLTSKGFHVKGSKWASSYMLYYEKGGYVDLSHLTLTTRKGVDNTKLMASWVKIPNTVCPTPADDITFEAAAEVCPVQRWVKEIGTGSYIDDTWYICCTQQAMNAGACSHTRKGNLIGMWKTYFTNPITAIANRIFSPAVYTADEAGFYSLVLFNCELGLNSVQADGYIRFATDPENPNDDTAIEPPGSLTGIPIDRNLPNGTFVLPFHIMGIVSYIVLLGWFSSRTRGTAYHSSIEDWIGRTIAIGLCAVVLRCLEYLLFDHTGDRHPVVAAVTAFGYAAKHGLTRALLVGLSTGVGVLPLRLRCCTLFCLVVLTCIYIGVVTALDFWAFLRDQGMEDWNDPIYEEMKVPIRRDLLITKACMEIIFWLWIWRTLCKTWGDLKRLNRESYFRFRCLFWVMVLLAVLSGCIFWAVISDRTDYGSIGLGENRVLGQLDEVVVFFMLLSVAILWRPIHLGIVSAGADLEMMQGITESNPDIDDTPPDSFKFT